MYPQPSVIVRARGNTSDRRTMLAGDTQPFPSCVLDEWVVMPNHVHGIIVIADRHDDTCHRRGVQLNAPTSNNNDDNVSRDPANRHSRISPHRDSLAVIVRTYKAAVTTFCRKEGHPDFQWQRNYYDRVIRDAAELNRIRQYISDNPANWNQDEHHAH
jgi:putative transposase